MKRILLLIDDMGSGGAERQFAYLAVGLKKAGYDIRLVKFYEGENFYGFDTDDAEIVTECMPEGKSGLKRSLIIRRIVKEWKPDLTICYKDGTCMAACIARAFVRFNLVVSERNTTQNLTRRDKLKFWLYRWADHIIPNSYSQANFIAKNSPKLMSRVKVIVNMVDTRRFFTVEQVAENDPPHIVTTARVIPQKNVLEYLAAIKILKEDGIKVHFDWYGKRDLLPEYWRSVCRHIENYGIEDMVTFHGATKDTVSVYRSADIFLLPSVYEGFPNVLCEAMACGLPSIATNVCDTPRILNDSRFLPEPTAYEISLAIKRMLSLSRKDRNHIGHIGAKKICELCSESAFLSDYMSLMS